MSEIDYQFYFSDNDYSFSFSRTEAGALKDNPPSTPSTADLKTSRLRPEVTSVGIGACIVDRTRGPLTLTLLWCAIRETDICMDLELQVGLKGL